MGEDDMPSMTEALIGRPFLDDAIGPSIDDIQDKSLLLIPDQVPEPQKPSRERLLYNIALAWVRARDDDFLTEESDGDACCR